MKDNEIKFFSLYHIAGINSEKVIRPKCKSQSNMRTHKPQENA